jgi:hypothetical protein
MKSPQSNKVNENSYEIETSSLGDVEENVSSAQKKSEKKEIKKEEPKKEEVKEEKKAPAP